MITRYTAFDDVPAPTRVGQEINVNGVLYKAWILSPPQWHLIDTDFDTLPPDTEGLRESEIIERVNALLAISSIAMFVREIDANTVVKRISVDGSMTDYTIVYSDTTATIYEGDGNTTGTPYYTKTF